MYLWCNWTQSVGVQLFVVFWQIFMFKNKPGILKLKWMIKYSYTLSIIYCERKYMSLPFRKLMVKYCGLWRNMWWNIVHAVIQQDFLYNFYQRYLKLGNLYASLLALLGII